MAVLTVAVLCFSGGCDEKPTVSKEQVRRAARDGDLPPVQSLIWDDLNSGDETQTSCDG